MTKQKFVKKLVSKYRHSPNNIKLKVIAAFYKISMQQMAEFIGVNLTDMYRWTNRNHHYMADDEVIFKLEEMLTDHGFPEELKSSYDFLDQKTKFKIVKSAFDLENSDVADFFSPPKAISTVAGWSRESGARMTSNAMSAIESKCEALL